MIIAKILTEEEASVVAPVSGLNCVWCVPGWICGVADACDIVANGEEANSGVAISSICSTFGSVFIYGESIVVWLKFEELPVEFDKPFVLVLS